MTRKRVQSATLPDDAVLEIVSFDRLAPADLASWQQLRGANAALDSPYFHPGFAAAVHGVRHDVVVAVARRTDGSPTMFLPVQAQRGIARPLDGNGDGTAVCDIGSVETPALLPVTCTPRHNSPYPV